jgi:hypothetical protein
MMRTGKIVLWLAAAMAAATVEAGKPEPEFRTRIPEITPARWSAKPQPLARPGKVTRDNYLEFIKRTYRRSLGPALRTAGGPENPYQYLFARGEAFFSLVEKDPARARAAMKFVRGDYAYRTQGKGAQKQTGFALFMQAVEVCRWLRANPAVNAEDREFLTRWLLLLEEKHGTFEYGAMNRSVGSAVGRDYLATLLPHDAKTAARRRYAEAVWNDWWPRRDTDENSSGYNGLWLHEIGLWLEITGKEQLFQDPGVKQLAERSLAQVTPLGVVPGFGDVVSWCTDPGQWISLMEKWASVYRDGRFKWAAHRLFEYTLAHEKEMWQWGNINDSTAEGLMDAWLAADDSIAEKEPELGSLVTYRKAVRWTNREERKTGRWFELLDKVIPNKLILRTGWQPEDTYALVELCPPMGHGQGDAGSINYLLSKGSVLLADTPYLIKDHAFHNCFVVKPDSVPAGARPRWRGEDFADMEIQVEDLRTVAQAAYARVHIRHYMGQPITLDRRIFFLGDSGLWVHDTATAEKACVARLGPAWQTVAVYGQRGERWVNTCWTTVPAPYIWDLRYMMQWENRPCDLMLCFLPHSGAAITIDDVSHDDTRVIVDRPLMNTAQRRVWYRAAATLEPGQSQHFSTVLVPHCPTPDASTLANRIESVLDTEDADVLKMVDNQGQAMWAGINESGRLLRAGLMETDARWFVARATAEGAVAYWLVEATRLTVNGREVFSAPRRRTVDQLTIKSGSPGRLP